MKKTLILCLIVVVAFGVMGAGFAKWSDKVYVNAQVNTGSVKVTITDDGVLDTGIDANFGDGIPDPGDFKDVASTVSTTAADKKSIQETITNAYPWYQTGSIISINNDGTIPVKVDEINMGSWVGNDLSPWLVLVGYKLEGETYAGAPWAIDKLNTYPANDFDDLLADLHAIQVDPGDALKATIQIGFIEDSAAGVMTQSANGSFQVEVICSQWNEVSVTP